MSPKQKAALKYGQRNRRIKGAFALLKLIAKELNISHSGFEQMQTHFEQASFKNYQRSLK